MKSIRFLSAFMMVLLILASFAETAEAQGRHRDRHAKRQVVRAHRVRHRVVVRRAHIRYAHLPRWRTSVTVVPTSAVIIKTKTNPYYFDRGVYYTPRNNAYVVVRPAAGVRIRVLPVGYRRIVVGPRNYFYYYGTFYTQVDKSDEYETVDAPNGAIVDALPDGYEVKTIDGTEYYVLDDVYYAEVETDEVEDGIGYEVVKI
jgi:Family of unknown function (DUF6515)